jgi:protein tyrosine/serine phosphatase
MFLVTLLFLLPALLVSEPKVESISTGDIPRFQMIDDGLYRGGQPELEGFEFLKNKGIKTVINLRTENGEEQIVKELGLNYIHIPISIKMWSKIPNAAIQEYFKVLNDPANYPIFFHCRRGADRTGALAGFYRIAVQGWEPKKAYSEARDIGMRWWYPAIKQQIYDFNGRKIEADLTPSLAQ